VNRCLQADPSSYSGAVRPLLASLLLLIAVVGVLASAGQRDTVREKQMADQHARIEAEVKAFRGRMGVAAIDLLSGETIAIDADARYPTASTIKIAVMLEAWQQATDRRLSMETAIPLKDGDKVGGAGVLRDLRAGLALTVADLVHLMIGLSDNTATNMLIERLGTARVNAGLDSYGLHNTRLFRPTFRDGRADVLPELEREYGLGMTTPLEMARLMALIAEGKAVDPRASDAMLATLRRQQDRAMIPRELPAGDGIQIGNKTGADEEKHAGRDGLKRHVRADAAIVTGPNLRYVVAIYARQIEDTRWGIENDAVVVGSRVSRMIFEYFSRPR
jgi:beta-lactamase class A